MPVPKRRSNPPPNLPRTLPVPPPCSPSGRDRFETDLILARLQGAKIQVFRGARDPHYVVDDNTIRVLESDLALARAILGEA